MKTRTKALLLSLCAVLLVTVSVLGTVAYLTSTQTVTNTFTVGKVKITLDEANVDEDYYLNGELSTKDEEGAEMPPRDQANDYHLLPGVSYDKDPTVHVTADSDKCYVYVKVENKISAIEAESFTHNDEVYGNISAQIASNDWLQLEDADSNAVANVYYKIVEDDDKDQDLVVFEAFAINADETNTSISSYAGETVTVTAYAVQFEGFDGAYDAWTDSGVANN